MKIAYVCADRGVPAFDWQKGCSIHVQEVIRGFRQCGHSVDLYASNIRGVIPHDLKGGLVHQLRRPSDQLSRGCREQAQLAANYSQMQALEAGGPYDLIYERYSLWNYAAMEFAARHGIPGVLEVNSPLIEEQLTFRGLVDVAGALRTTKRCFSAASAICAVSEQVRNYVAGVIGTVDKIAVISNGVDTERFSKTLRYQAGNTARFTVGFVGSLKPWHGVRELVNAFANVNRRAPESRLLIVGDGPERKSIEAQVADLQIANAVTLTGAVPPMRIPELLEAMDVAVAPYPALGNHYFSPMKVFEYMAAGLPVVATSAGQLKDLIVDECNGLLCEPGDEKALADALLCLMRDPALRFRLGRTARQAVLHSHTWKRVVTRILSVTDKYPLRPDKGIACVAP